MQKPQSKKSDPIAAFVCLVFRKGRALEVSGSSPRAIQDPLGQLALLCCLYSGIRQMSIVFQAFFLWQLSRTVYEPRVKPANNAALGIQNLAVMNNKWWTAAVLTVTTLRGSRDFVPFLVFFGRQVRISWPEPECVSKINWSFSHQESSPLE